MSEKSTNYTEPLAVGSGQWTGPGTGPGTGTVIGTDPTNGPDQASRHDTTSVAGTAGQRMSITSMLSETQGTSGTQSTSGAEDDAARSAAGTAGNGPPTARFTHQQAYREFQARVGVLLDLEHVHIDTVGLANFFHDESLRLNPAGVSAGRLAMDPHVVNKLKTKLQGNGGKLMEKVVQREKLLAERAAGVHDDVYGDGFEGSDDDAAASHHEEYISHNGRRVRRPVSYYDELAADGALGRKRRSVDATPATPATAGKKKARPSRGGNGWGGARKKGVSVKEMLAAQHGDDVAPGAGAGAGAGVGGAGGAAVPTATAGTSAHSAAARSRSRPSRRKPDEAPQPETFADASRLLHFRTPVPVPQPKRLAKEQRAIDKQYDNVYLAIWKDLSRKDGPRIYRLLVQAQQTKFVNLKKTAMLAARESKRWQLRTNKSQKDVQSKARRSMREMFNFWKKNEREERELKKKAEKEAFDKVKKEEEEREAKRQSRKLNFLITQTELYSHFIGNKIKTSELEGDMGDARFRGAAGAHGTAQEVDLQHARDDFGSIDFDADDDTLRRTAAANAQTALMSAQAKAQAFNAAAHDSAPKDTNADDDSEMNFQNPTSLGDINITQPKLLTCTLKEYQVKGLNWLANLYDQGINGILADEMGLGKTVQSISVLAYLAETHGIWGPFLVVTPASTLHNWQQEISRFVPDLKVLPYWGSAKDRKVLRKFWDRKKLVYDKNAPFHVVVTSYQLVVTDAQYFQRMKWQYMILDEAQAIKSSQSSRWKVLLSFSCRNRLLLTGTPIQNSMQELWALLHFIMPSLFDSHDEFSEWFSKDIESHAQSNTQLNEQQLRRLHMILKPFMLRRIKKNVQSELGDKIEIDLYCDLTTRQKKLYQMVKSQISLMDLMDKLRGEPSKKTDDDDNTESLLNLVMQFRKVCNHPDLFERADTKSAFAFGTFAETASFLREKDSVDVHYTSRNAIRYNLPRLVYDDLLLPHFDNSVTDAHHVTNNRLNIWSPDHVHASQEGRGAFSWLKFVDTTPGQLVRRARRGLIANAIRLQHCPGSAAHRFDVAYDADEFERPVSRMLLISETCAAGRSSDVAADNGLKELYTLRHKCYEDMYLNVAESAAFSRVMAPPVELECSTRNFAVTKTAALFDQELRSALMPLSLDLEYDLMTKQVPLEQFPKSQMLPPALNSKVGYSTIHLPSMKRFVIESGKLNTLDVLLRDLKANDHKVLIYFQMTRMMDLMEEYLKYKQYKYIRLDGSSKLSDRRDLVHDWQTRPELFIFLLSTRAGGLGINLTAADTVVFYDSDWNPTIDSQAMDRAHRLGQTRQVTVYRLLVRGTIEERMRDRAKQKEHVQQVVMEGKATLPEDSVMGNSASDKKKEVAMLLLDG